LSTPEFASVAAWCEPELAVEHFSTADTGLEVIGSRAPSALALGAVRRRARQTLAAREAIEQAVAIFDDCGASGWADNARAVLGRMVVAGARRG
jgi:hypothetical protein